MSPEDHAAAKAVVQEQVDQWLELFDDDMQPLAGAVIPPQVQKWKEAHEREKRVAAWLRRWGPVALAAVGLGACAAVARAYGWPAVAGAAHSAEL